MDIRRLLVRQQFVAEGQHHLDAPRLGVPELDAEKPVERARGQERAEPIEANG